MAVESRDGMMHHSAGRAKLHDEIHGSNPAKKVPPRPAGAGGEGHPQPSPHSIQEHVGTHGPAIEIHVKHDKATGKHHVTSHHGADGKQMHHSVHGNPKEAHELMAHAMGLKEGMGDEETPDEYGGTESPEEEAAESRTGGGIPGLA